MDRLISEQAVIESIEFFQMNPQHFDFVNLIDDIKEIPSAEPKQEWISVNDRLPDDPLDTDEYVEYLVTDAKGQCGVGFYRYDVQAWDSVHWGWLEREDKVDNHEAFIEPKGIGKVVAWMPLQKPYKGDNEGREGMSKEELEELKGLAASMGLYDDKNPCKKAVILGKAIKALEQEPKTEQFAKWVAKEIFDENLEDIKAEIRQKQWHIGVDSANQVIEIINKYTGGQNDQS